MSLFRRYLFYKRTLVTLFTINILVIGSGAYAFFRYIHASDVDAVPLMVISGLTLIFGFLLPTAIVRHITEGIDRAQDEIKQLASWISIWLKHYKSQELGLKDVTFWAVLALMGIEAFGLRTKDPLGRFLREVALVIKQEMHKEKAKHQFEES